MGGIGLNVVCQNISGDKIFALKSHSNHILIYFQSDLSGLLIMMMSLFGKIKKTIIF